MQRRGRGAAGVVRASHVNAECAVVRRKRIRPKSRSKGGGRRGSCAHRVVELINQCAIHPFHLITHRFLPHPHSRSDPAPPPLPCPADSDQSSGQRHSPQRHRRRPPPPAAMGSSHRHLMRLLDDPFFPFPPPPPTSSLTSTCPFLPPPSPFAFPHHPDLLDLYLPADPFFAAPPIPSPHAFLLHDLTDRVAALELTLAARAAAPQPARRKYTYAATEPGGRKVKWTAEEKPRGGGRALKWEAELASPNDDGFDRKWRWEAKSKGAGGKTKTKWGTEITGKGSLQPWSHAYTWEEDFTASDDEDELEVEERKPEKSKKIKAAARDKEDDKKKKTKPARTCVQIEEIPEDNTAGCDAIRKAFAMGNGKGKAKELSPQDAALLIQMNYRAHLAHRSQVLRCLRDLAVAKAKLKELRSLFYNLSYRRRLSHDHEERQRFSEKIIVLLLTVDALEGPDFMVRTAKKSMLEELESMLEIVDPQPPGKQRSFSRRKFDLPEGGAIPNEKTAGVNNAVRVINTGKGKQ